ncbi:Amino-acid permease BAT1 [Glycine soja]
MTMDPDMLAKAIVEHYYSTFDTNQSSLANLHQEGSMLTFEGQKIQGVSSICHHSISTINCQPSGINVSMLVFVSGNLQLVGEQHILKFNEAATSVNFSLAQLIQVIILLCTSGKNGGGYEASKYEVIAFNGGIMFLHGRINSVPISVISFLRQLGVIWNVLGVFVLMILIPSVATKRASLKFAFTHFNTKNEDGIKSKPNIFLLGLLMSQYTLIGYDASAHMTEETKGADRNRPKGIASEVGIFIIVGWGYILGISFAVTNIPYFLRESNDAEKIPQWNWGHYLLGSCFYGLTSITSNSRMAYAFSRDRVMPLSSLWHKVNKKLYKKS